MARIRRWVPTLFGLAALLGLVLILNPTHVWQAMRQFQIQLLPAIVLLYLSVYLLQGVRWHYLLRDAGVGLHLRDSLLLNLAGQAVTAIVPMGGDLTRAAFAAEAGQAHFGTVAATVTVQELTYVLLIVLLALPALLTLHQGVAVIGLTVLAIALVVAILTVSPLFRVVHRVFVGVPLLRRFYRGVEDLRSETIELLHRPDALALSALDLVRAVAAVSAFWLEAEGVAPGRLGWWQAALVLTVASVGAAVTFIPGGAGANEAGVAGLLILLGLSPGAAGAVALVQRVLMTGLALLVGFGAYGVARRRFRLGNVFELARSSPARVPAA